MKAQKTLEEIRIKRLLKKQRSGRNRHTGRINAAKQRILDEGQPMRADNGKRIYVYHREHDKARGATVVRDFNALSI